MNSLIQTLLITYPISAVILFGLCAVMVGSVLSMLTYRLPIMLEQQYAHADDKEPDHKAPNFNLFLPRSHCKQCKKTIPAHHNIPILSYMLLAGRCCYCRSPISWRYPAIEILTLLLSLLAWSHFGYHLVLLWVLPFIWMLICLVVIDMEHQLLPDSITLSLLWIGLLVNTQSVFCSLPCAVWSTVGAYMSLWLFIKVFYLLTGKIGMGHGDFKLFAALGAWFGWTALGPILIVSCILGSVIGLLYLWITKQNRHTPIPFGPYLCMAGLLHLFAFY